MTTISSVSLIWSTTNPNCRSPLRSTTMFADPSPVRAASVWPIFSSRFRYTSGSRFPRSRYNGVWSIISICAAADSSIRTSSSRLTCVIANRSPPLVTTSAGMIASVSGILIRSVVPCPTLLCTSTVPPIFSMFVFTTSIPTPRPLTFVTFSAVENPGAKIRPTASRSPIRAAWSGVISPFSTALRLITSGSIPFPSSVISMFTCPP